MAGTEDGEAGPAEYFSVKVDDFDLCRSYDGGGGPIFGELYPRRIPATTVGPRPDLSGVSCQGNEGHLLG